MHNNTESYKLMFQPHPYKEKMISGTLESLGLSPRDAVFVDDNPAICERVRSSMPELRVLNIGFDFESLCEVEALIEQKQL